MKEIIKYIEELFEGNNFLYSGSYALNQLKILDREVGDIDIVFHKNYYEKILKILEKKNVIIPDSNSRYPNNNLIIIVELKNGKHIDIFFEKDFYLYQTMNEKFLHPFEIAKKKMNLLLNNSKQPNKHIQDIKTIMNFYTKKENNLEVVNIEDIPF